MDRETFILGVARDLLIVAMQAHLLGTFTNSEHANTDTIAGMGDLYCALAESVGETYDKLGPKQCCVPHDSANLF